MVAQKNYKRVRGFTLIELLVVIAIIGLLSSVVLASLNTARGKAKDAATLSDIKQITLALHFARDSSSNDRFPGTAGAWQCMKSSGTCWRGGYGSNPALTSALAPYMPNIPKTQAPSGTYMHDAYMYLPYYTANIGASPPGTYIIYALQEDMGASGCNGYYAGAYDAGWYYCYYLVEPL